MNDVEHFFLEAGVDLVDLAVREERDCRAIGLRSTCMRYRFFYSTD